MEIKSGDKAILKTSTDRVDCSLSGKRYAGQVVTIRIEPLPNQEELYYINYLGSTLGHIPIHWIDKVITKVENPEYFL